MMHLSQKPARKLTSREIAKIIEAFAGSLVPMAENGPSTMREVYEYLGDKDFMEKRIEIFKMIQDGFDSTPFYESPQDLTGTVKRGTWHGNG